MAPTARLDVRINYNDPVTEDILGTRVACAYVLFSL